MRSIIRISLIAAALLMAVTAFAGDDSKKGEMSWFDMQNCVVCSKLGAYPELMPKMTWEHHNIENGIVAVTTVADGYVDQYRKASAEMHAAGMKLMESGEKATMCGMCTSMSAIMMDGDVMMENVETKHGSVWLMTSANPDKVAKLQKWGKHTMAEMKKMEMHEDASHEGHDHG